MKLGPGDIKPGATALDVALTQLAVVGDDSEQVREYIRSVGLDPRVERYRWCAAFAFWCCQQAGLWVPRTGRVHTMAERGKAIVVPVGAFGDVGLHLRQDGSGHAGIIMSRAATTYDTVEGNTNAVGSTDGDRVAIRTRPAPYWNVFLRPARLGEDLT